VEVYGAIRVDAPKGYELTGEFRHPKRGDSWIGVRNVNTTECWDRNTFSFSGMGHRLIVRKVDPIHEIYGKNVTRETAPAGYEATGEFRAPLDDEYYVSADSFLQPLKGSQLFHFADENSRRRLILRKKLVKKFMIEVLEETPRQLKAGEIGVVPGVVEVLRAGERDCVLGTLRLLGQVFAMKVSSVGFSAYKYIPIKVTEVPE
jgi:hypothetical protein